MKLSNYRSSHSSEGYGEHYEKTYTQGFYRYQWEMLEEPLLREILSSFRDGKSKNILDFACGTGRILSVNEDFIDDSTGVDISASMIEIAKDKCPKSEIFHRDITKEKLAGSFDVITSFRFFLNAEDELKRDVLNALYKNLSEAGFLVVNIHMNSQSFLGLAYRLRNWFLKEKVANTLSYSEFERFLNQAGFEIVDSHWYSFWPRTGWRFDSIARIMVPRLDRFWKKFRLPQGVAQSFILVCKKSRID